MSHSPREWLRIVGLQILGFQILCLEPVSRVGRSKEEMAGFVPPRLCRGSHALSEGQGTRK